VLSLSLLSPENDNTSDDEWVMNGVNDGVSIISIINELIPQNASQSSIIVCRVVVFFLIVAYVAYVAWLTGSSVHEPFLNNYKWCNCWDHLFIWISLRWYGWRMKKMWTDHVLEARLDCENERMWIIFVCWIK
jgi:hypothetical protein